MISLIHKQTMASIAPALFETCLSRRALVAAALTASLGLGGCQLPGTRDYAPDPSVPWVPSSSVLEQASRPLADMRGAGEEGKQAGGAGRQTAGPGAGPGTSGQGMRPVFSLPAVSPAGQMQPADVAIPDHPVTLPELIDLAQRLSPVTRIAWEQARQAASAVGLAEALYLPMVTAAVVGGWQRTESPLPIALGDIDSIRTTTSGVIPALTLQWLLFDFGERTARVEAARHLSFAANVQFQAAHQRLIQAVALAYYNYDTARIRSRVAAEAHANAQTVLQAVEARLKQGVATTVELAQARRQVAQTRLTQVQAEGLERDAYQALIAAVGLRPDTKLEIVPLPQRELPRSLYEQAERAVHDVLARRPDVLSAYAAAQAAQAAVTAAEAAFAPKLFLTGVTAVTHHHLNVNGLSLLGQPISSAGVLLGVTFPLYDGGLREQHLHAARARADEAQALWRQAQDTAVMNLVSTSSTLKTALQAHEAARAWAVASATTYDAALEAYRHGVGTLTVASEAMIDLLAARMAEVDAYAAALSAAVNLAHAVGELTSADAIPGPAAPSGGTPHGTVPARRR